MTIIMYVHALCTCYFYDTCTCMKLVGSVGLGKISNKIPSVK